MLGVAEVFESGVGGEGREGMYLMIGDWYEKDEYAEHAIQNMGIRRSGAPIIANPRLPSGSACSLPFAAALTCSLPMTMPMRGLVRA